MVDPVIAGSFATIVSLIAQFRSERQSTKDTDFQDFLKWMVTNNHNEIKGYLESNTEVQIGIKALLNKSNNDFKQLLNNIDLKLSMLSSRIDEFQHINKGIYGNATLSSQSITILKTLINSGGSTFLVTESASEPPELLILDSDSSVRSIDYKEQQFLKSDLEDLVNLELLSQGLNSQGYETFTIKRLAMEFIG